MYIERSAMGTCFHSDSSIMPAGNSVAYWQAEPGSVILSSQKWGAKMFKYRRRDARSMVGYGQNYFSLVAVGADNKFAAGRHGFQAIIYQIEQ